MLDHFEYLVMPFGLTNTPAIFQALVNVLRDFLIHFVFAHNKSAHKTHVRHVLQRLLENNFFFGLHNPTGSNQGQSYWGPSSCRVANATFMSPLMSPFPGQKKPKEPLKVKGSFCLTGPYSPNLTLSDRSYRFLRCWSRSCAFTTIWVGLETPLVCLLLPSSDPHWPRTTCN